MAKSMLSFSCRINYFMEYPILKRTCCRINKSQTMPGRDRESSSRKDLEAVLQPVLEFLAEEASLGMEPTSLSK